MPAHIFEAPHGWNLHNPSLLYTLHTPTPQPEKITCIIGIGIMFMKTASDPHPPHTRQKYEQTSGRKYDPKCFKTRPIRQFGGHVFVHIFALYVGVGVAKRIPNYVHEKLHSSCMKIFIWSSFPENYITRCVVCMCGSDDMEIWSWNYSLGESHCSYTTLCFRNKNQLECRRALPRVRGWGCMPTDLKLSDLNNLASSLF